MKVSKQKVLFSSISLISLNNPYDQAHLSTMMRNCITCLPKAICSALLSDVLLQNTANFMRLQIDLSF